MGASRKNRIAEIASEKKFLLGTFSSFLRKPFN